MRGWGFEGLRFRDIGFRVGVWRIRGLRVLVLGFRV